MGTGFFSSFQDQLYDESFEADPMVASSDPVDSEAFFFAFCTYLNRSYFITRCQLGRVSSVSTAKKCPPSPCAAIRCLRMCACTDQSILIERNERFRQSGMNEWMNLFSQVNAYNGFEIFWIGRWIFLGFFWRVYTFFPLAFSWMKNEKVFWTNVLNSIINQYLNLKSWNARFIITPNKAETWSRE